jgi:hypothetical protein
MNGLLKSIRNTNTQKIRFGMFCYTILRDSSLGLRLLTIIAFRESHADGQFGQKWSLNFVGCVILLPLDESLKFSNPWVTGVIAPKMTNLLKPRVGTRQVPMPQAAQLPFSDKYLKTISRGAFCTPKRR